jgi:hypothetical protein
VFSTSRSKHPASKKSFRAGSSYQWSTDLLNWQASGTSNASGVIVTITTTKITDTTAPANDLIGVTATLTAGTTKRIYARLQATKL